MKATRSSVDRGAFFWTDFGSCRLLRNVLRGPLRHSYLGLEPWFGFAEDICRETIPVGHGAQRPPCASLRAAALSQPIAHTARRQVKPVVPAASRRPRARAAGA